VSQQASNEAGLQAIKKRQRQLCGGRQARNDVVQGSVSDPDPYRDPDPHGSALNWTPWIRIRIRDADPGSGLSSYEIPYKEIEINKFFVLKIHCKTLTGYEFVLVHWNYQTKTLKN